MNGRFGRIRAAALGILLCALAGCGTGPRASARAAGGSAHGVARAPREEGPSDLRPAGRATAVLAERGVDVCVLGGRDADVEGRAARAARALPILERVAGFRYGGPAELRIELHDDLAATGGYGGFFDGGVVHLWSGADDEALLHELAHLWFPPGPAGARAAEERWLIEGLAEWSSVAVLRAEPGLGDARRAHAVRVGRFLEAERDGSATALAGWAPPPPGPGGGGLPPADASRCRAWYARAYAFFHVVDCYAGERGLADLHARLGAAAPARPFAVGADDYLRELVRSAPALDGVAVGWIRPGLRERRFGLRLFEDADGDGVDLGEEIARGTAPDRWDTDGDGKSDGQEVFARLGDPLKSDGAVPPRPAPAGASGLRLVVLEGAGVGFLLTDGGAARLLIRPAGVGCLPPGWVLVVEPADPDAPCLALSPAGGEVALGRRLSAEPGAEVEIVARLPGSRSRPAGGWIEATIPAGPGRGLGAWPGTVALVSLRPLRN